MKKLILIMLLIATPVFAQDNPNDPNVKPTPIECAFCIKFPEICPDELAADCNAFGLTCDGALYMEHWVNSLSLVLKQPDVQRSRRYNNRHISRILTQIVEGIYKGDKVCK